jgi:putative addiction module CopG family antidote
MSISLTPHLEELVREKIASGSYNSASEVLREALRLLEQEDQLRLKLQNLRQDMDDTYLVSFPVSSALFPSPWGGGISQSENSRGVYQLFPVWETKLPAPRARNLRKTTSCSTSVLPREEQPEREVFDGAIDVAKRNHG